MEITSVQNKLIKETTKLHQKKYRDQFGHFLVEGYHLYEEARTVGNVVQVFTTDHAIVGEDVIYVNEAVLQKLSDAKNPQGVVTVCQKVDAQEPSDQILLLDHIQDPGNLGTLLRSALAFGFTTIVLDNTVDVYNDKVLRSTQGAIFKLNFIHSSILEFMEKYNWILYYGTAMTGVPIQAFSTMPPFGIILGNEGAGVNEHILRKTTKNITIPMIQTESLNVGVAGSIIMYELQKKLS
ncbi:TrmH family RNA methyltransferase [Candidatus Xianfuyuplasma coldseepsis]|uniref:RNA methyltransferase n=1 Tax=Candidatus Xianfuyuplasma coldseepsis TaxID=2782163 RepID=A0A7L7KPK7_9MOLU|nr:RNA methyltransferase [Xianfuyuplasma coldseepsis]QMS84369.1 RNA methyltransferase [Xianfuyuplasma coldseepsis]